MLPSISNRFNGNLCFGTPSHTGIYIIECERQGGNVYYDMVPVEISSIADIGARDYLVTTKTNLIGKFSHGTYNSSFNDITPYEASYVQAATSGDYYVLDNLNDLLIKYTNDILVWTFALEGNIPVSNILLRESEGTIVHYDRNNIYTIRDNGDDAKLLYSTHVGIESTSAVVGSSHYMPRHVFGRTRQVYTDSLPSSSSSSSPG